MIIKSIKDFKDKPEFFDYLQESKKDILDFKMSKPRYDSKDVVSNGGASKQFKPVSISPISIDDSIEKMIIKVVANTSMYIDNHLDMLGVNGAKDSIRSRSGIIPMLHDHIHEISAQIGNVKKISYENIPLQLLGWSEDGTANALTFTFEAVRKLNEMIFEQYALGNIKQHSVGLMYEDIKMCVNSDKDWWKDENDNFQKYYGLAINKDRADKNGYFWYVPKWKLLENSSVLFGSNELTPTLEISLGSLSGKKSLISAKPSYISEINEFNNLFN